MPCPGLIIFYNYLFSWYIYAINVNYNGFMETRYNIGDIIYWYCDEEQCIHHAEVLFVNYAGVGYPDINYEVTTECCGELKTLFIDEEKIITPDL